MVIIVGLERGQKSNVHGHFCSWRSGDGGSGHATGYAMTMVFI